jgi:hypothetical protein
MKKLGLALLAVMLLALPAAASVQNIKVSGYVDSTWLLRNKFDLGNQDQSKQFRQNLFLTQAQLRVDADLSDNVSATMAIINERAWGDYADSRTGNTITSNTANDVDINLAYVTLREMLYSPLTVVIGRQNFAFGNSFVIDSAGPNNAADAGGLKGVAEDLTMATAQDAVRLIFDYNPLTIDVVASKVASGNLLGTGNHDDDTDLLGVNANWQLGDKMGTVLEAYFWAKYDKSTKTNGQEADRVYMPGIHASANILDGLMLSGELAWQKGTKVLGTASAERNAIAGQLIANYKVPLESTKNLSPVLTTSYTYYSGDSNAADVSDVYEAWDPMYENQGGGKIYNTLFNATNSHIVAIRGSIVPMEDLTASIEWDGLWLAKALADTNNDGLTSLTLLQPDGTTITANTNTAKGLGNEVQLGLKYDYTEDVQLGATYDMFFPGGAFRDSNNSAATQVMVNANVLF